MLQALILSASTRILPTPADERVGIYVLAAIVGLLVCGIISVAKEMRSEKAARA